MMLCVFAMFVGIKKKNTNEVPHCSEYYKLESLKGDNV